MGTSLRHLRLGCCLIAVTVGVLGSIEAAWAAADTKQVLVLYSTSRDSPMSTAGDRELPLILDQGLEHDLVYFSEYIDQGRFPDAAYQQAFSDFLRVKYKGQRIDLVIPIQAAAVQFVNQRRNELFPDTPVVFLALSSPTSRLANSTGVIADLDLASTLALAVELQPDIRNVFVVSGAGVPDKEYERLTRMQLQSFERRFAITYLSGLATKDLEVRLATLPEHSIVYYLAVYQDGQGEAFAPMQYSERVAAVARAPTYTWSDALMGHGIVGGSLLDRQTMMQAIGKLALRVLHGEPADNIPTASPSLNVSQVDWRQLRRWGISEARVPSGALIQIPRVLDVGSVQSLHSRAAAVLLAQTGLIAGLLVQRRRRRQAEEQVRGGQVELRASYNRIRDLASRLLNAQDTERSRIARELHDDISQQVALLAIDLELLSGAVQPDSEALAEEILNRTQTNRQERARSLAPAASRQIATDRFGLCAPRTPTGVVPSRDGHHVHPRQRAVDGATRSDGVPVPSRTRSAAERSQVQQGARSLGAVAWRARRTRPDHRRRWGRVRR